MPDPANIQITVNGQRHAIPKAQSLEEALTTLGYKPQLVVAELNGEAVSPQEFKLKTVPAGARIEVIQIVAGG